MEYTLSRIKNAYIDYGIGVSHFVLPREKLGKNVNIESLFGINEFSDQYYSVNVKAEKD